jgi:hypothetical protein
VGEGPSRIIARLQQGADNTSLAWVAQAGTGHFMDTSTLPTDVTTTALPDPASYQLLLEQLTFIVCDRHAPDTGLVLGLDQNPGSVRCGFAVALAHRGQRRRRSGH